MQARNQEGEAPLKIFRLPWKNVLDIVWNYWTLLKQFLLLSENSSLPVVSQAGHGLVLCLMNERKTMRNK